MPLLIIEQFPEDLMRPLGVEVLPPQTSASGLVRAPANYAVFVQGDEGATGWWLCPPGDIVERAAFKKRPTVKRR